MKLQLRGHTTNDEGNQKGFEVDTTIKGNVDNLIDTLNGAVTLIAKVSELHGFEFLPDNSPCNEIYFGKTCNPSLHFQFVLLDDDNKVIHIA